MLGEVTTTARLDIPAIIRSVLFAANSCRCASSPTLSARSHQHRHAALGELSDDLEAHPAIATRHQRSPILGHCHLH